LTKSQSLKRFRQKAKLMKRILCTALFLLLCAFAQPQVSLAKPNVLLIVSEDNGPELGCYGDEFARTPHLDRLAAEGVRFHNAFVPYSVCSPSRACFLTGTYAHQNGQIGLATHKFALYHEQTPNIVTLLQPAGYAAGLIGKLHINPESAFPFDFRAIPGANFNRNIPVDQYVDAARRFWKQADGKPWFLSLNFPDAHLPFLRQADGRPRQPQTGDDVEMLPWIGADSPRLREIMADYYNCMSRLDDWVGLLLAALDETGAADNTLVLYIGDHGAQFPRGKGSVYEGGLRVPLIVGWPGHAKAGVVCDELVSTIDILPTVLRAAGVDSTEQLPGYELQPLLSGNSADRRRQYIFAMTTGSFPRNCFIQQSVRDTRYKLISSPRPGTRNLIADSYLDPQHQHFVFSGVLPQERAEVSETVEATYRRWEQPPRYELYDLENDPYEWHNLAEDAQHAETKQRLIAALTSFQEDTRDPFLDPANVEAFVTEQLNNRDLAYRTNKSFRWSYLDGFRRWRENR
jgi:N-sulfoglucosamine sulfohydrolase